MGIPNAMASFLAQKYAIAQQEADARTKATDASAMLDTTRAGLMPAESTAQIGLSNAQAKTSTIAGGLMGADSAARNRLYDVQGYAARTGADDAAALTRDDLTPPTLGELRIGAWGGRMTGMALGDSLGQRLGLR